MTKFTPEPSKTTPAEIPDLQLTAEALAFLRDVMLGTEQEAKTIIVKTTKKSKEANTETNKESYTAKTFYVPAELETRMKAAERLLKYNQDKSAGMEEEKQYGVILLPKINEPEDNE